jgi:hypothetical protein
MMVSVMTQLCAACRPIRKRGSSDAYEVVKNLSKFFEGTPKVQTYEVANSTFHNIATVAA